MSAFRSSPWAPLVSAAFLAVATAAPVSQPMAMAQPAVAALLRDGESDQMHAA